MLPKDPYILLSYINTKLRDDYSSLEELCSSLDIPHETLCETLSKAGFSYDVTSNQFK